MSNTKDIAKNSTLHFDWTAQQAESNDLSSDEELKSSTEVIQIQNTVPK